MRDAWIAMGNHLGNVGCFPQNYDADVSDNQIYSLFFIPKVLIKHGRRSTLGRRVERLGTASFGQRPVSTDH